MKNKRMRLVMCVVAALLAVASSSCLRDSAEVGESSGIGRENVSPRESDTSADTTETAETAETAESDLGTGRETKNNASETEEPPPLDKPDDTVVAKAEWSVDDGVYTYKFPKRVEKIDLNEMARTSTALFEDQGDDLSASWYPGKMTYDETTGEATASWDRYQSTQDLIRKYHGIYRGDTSRKVCYLTFDCGYEYGPTTDILDTLKEKKAPATFFLVSNYVRDDADIVQRMLDEGHIIGNHTKSHKNMTQVDAETFIDELHGLEDIFYEKFPDAEPLMFWRPPQGACNEWVLKLSDMMGYRTTLWSCAYYDWNVENQKPYDEAISLMKKGLHPGAVYLLHTESTTNAEILGELIDYIRAQGYDILPLCDIAE